MPEVSLQQVLMRAAAACELGDYVQAERLCAAILRAQPKHFTTLYLCANAQARRGKLDDALSSCDEALAIWPNHAETLHLRGSLLQQLQRFDDALLSYDGALAIRSDYAETHYNRAVVLHELRRYDEALAGFDQALAIRPNHAATLNYRGNTLQALRRLNEALESYDQSLAVEPDCAGTFVNRGYVLQQMTRLAEASASFEQAIVIDPSHPHALSGVAECALRACDFARRDELRAALQRAVMEKTAIVFPFVLLGYTDQEELHKRAAQQFISSRLPKVPPPLWRGEKWHNDRIKIAYMSADFRAHALASLITELIELHDRSCFEVIGVSLGPDDGSAMRQRFAGAFDRFYDVRAVPDRDVAKMLHDLRTDIVVDLNGYTMGCRPEILAWRPAPIAVSYLGYPGTMGADFIDYILADANVLPFDHQSYFTEQIIHLPDCYQCNDGRRAAAVPMPSRDACGLPTRGLVFCCFNSTWKIAPPIFDAWMRLLKKVDGSVLWLLHDSGDAERNLRREATARGVDPARLVFAPKLPTDEHLARHAHADLFLDTLPYNAHTTASDALWCGLPVITCRGAGFAARVAASVLKAIGLGELVTESLEEYETLALTLATDHALRADVKRRLVENRLKFPLFDSVRFSRHIEAAYTAMWRHWQDGSGGSRSMVNVTSD